MADREDIAALLNPRENLLHVFFYLLWQKHGRRNNIGIANIKIPDTVILNHSRAVQWYFSSKEGTIMKKNRQKLASNTIVEHFSRCKSKSGAAANLFERDIAREDGIVCTPVPANRLRSLLADGVASGSLQMFVDPKAESGVVFNSVIGAKWTPNVFYVEKRSNCHPITHERTALEDKLNLEETNAGVKVAPLVSSRTTEQLENACQTIAAHIESVHGCRVGHVSIHAKVDEREQLWVLYCSSLRVIKAAAPEHPITLTLAAADKPSADTSKSRALPPPPTQATRSSDAKAKSVTCNLCQTEIPWVLATTVAQKHVLFPLSVVAFMSSNPPGTAYTDQPMVGEEVPQHVLLLHKEMTAADYMLHCQDPTWGDLPVKLCENCSAGLQAMTASFNVGPDGAIRVPELADTPAVLAGAASASLRGTQPRKPLRRLRSTIDSFSYGQSVMRTDSFLGDDDGIVDDDDDTQYAWERNSTASDRAPIFGYDDAGRAVAPSHETHVVPRARSQNSTIEPQEPSSTQRVDRQARRRQPLAERSQQRHQKAPAQLPPLSKRNQPIDAKKLSAALRSVTPVTQPHRREPAGRRTMTPEPTPM